MQLDHLALYVADLERAERFYADVLGLERLMRLPDQVLFKMGTVNIGLMQADPAGAGHPGGRSARTGVGRALNDRPYWSEMGGKTRSAAFCGEAARDGAALHLMPVHDE